MIAQLKAMVGLDSRQYVAGARQVEGTTQRMQRSFQQIGRVIGVSFSVAGVVMMTRAISRWASEVSIAARNAGVLTSEMAALNRVAEQSNMQTRDMRNILARLQGELINAARGSESAAEKFERMGLSVAELARMTPAQQLQEVARAATQTGVPLENLTELFGQQLGRNARVALEQIARDGLPEVDTAIGRTMDQIEAMSSAWSRMLDVAKVKTISWATEIGNLWFDTAGGVAGIFMKGSFTEGRDIIRAQREERITKMIQQREDEQKRNAEEISRIYEQSLQRQLDTLNEAMEKRIEQSERLRGTAPALSSMEQMGASFGGERTAALRAADRQLQVAREQLRIQQEFSGKLDAVKERLDNLVRNQ